MYLNKSYNTYIVNGKICSSRLAKQDFFYIDDFFLGGGHSKWPKNSKLCILHRIPYLTIRSMLILSPKSSADASEFE